MKAVILAAGKGTRMLPLTLEKPKPMLEVLGKPILHHAFDTLPDEIKDVVLVVGYKDHVIRDYFGIEFEGRNITYVDGSETLGTGHALTLAKPHLGEDEKFLLLYPDNLYNKADLVTALQSGPGVVVHEVDEPNRFGVVSTNEQGNITGIPEYSDNPPTNLAVTGAYVFDGNIFRYESVLDERRKEYLINSMIEGYIKDFSLPALRTSFWVPLSYPEDIKKAEEILARKTL